MKTIFVVDDDEAQAQLLAQALACRAWRVRAFSDPIRALAALNTEGADLLVADLSMPWIDGGDVVATARLRRPDLPVILVSGYARGQQIARQYGIPFFHKPIDLDRLRAAAERLLGRDSHLAV